MDRYRGGHPDRETAATEDVLKPRHRRGRLPASATVHPRPPHGLGAQRLVVLASVFAQMFRPAQQHQVVETIIERIMVDVMHNHPSRCRPVGRFPDHNRAQSPHVRLGDLHEPARRIVAIPTLPKALSSDRHLVVRFNGGAKVTRTMNASTRCRIAGVRAELDTPAGGLEVGLTAETRAGIERAHGTSNANRNPARTAMLIAGTNRIAFACQRLPPDERRHAIGIEMDRRWLDAVRPSLIADHAHTGHLRHPSLFGARP